jgi:Cdc6-like AAA superfamily ATPase
MTAPAQHDLQMLALRAGQVFTPTAPIDQPSLFAGRRDQIRLIVDAVNQRGQHAILYGEPGVGKTSLVNVVASFTNTVKKVVAPRVNCDDSDDFASVWRKVFEKLSDETSLQIPKPPTGFASTPNAEELSPMALLGDKVTPDSVRRALKILASTSVPIIVIDEFDRLRTGRRRAFADMVKTLSDDAVAATVVLVGVADSVEQLLAEHQSVERPLLQIRMPRMSTEEIKDVVTNGLNSLGMKIGPAALGRIAKLSQGLPHYAHLLALYASRAALDSQSMTVDVSAVDKAIKQATSGVQQTILSAYEIAVRSAAKNNLFADVLLACALAETSELGFFAAQDVRQPLSKFTDKHYDIPAFAQHLNEFSEAKRGNILIKSGTPRLYRYRFRNPLMQPYVIMQGIKRGRIVTSMLD